MRNAQFAAMLDDLKAEVGVSLSAAANTQQLDHLKSLLNRIYERYYHDFGWSFLRTRTDVDVSAGTRFIAVPSTIRYLDIDEAHVRDAQPPSSYWYKLCEGIEESDYNTVEEGLVQSYPRKWGLYSEDGTSPTQIELWPVPDVACVVRFRGRRSFTKMVNNADPCQLDDKLIVLFAAAEYLARQKAEDAGMKMELAVRHYAMLRGQDTKNKKFNYRDESRVRRRPRPYRDYIPNRNA
jgi:hypothetical protein